MTSNDQDKDNWWQSLLHLLSKLGILRYGRRSYTYTSGRDRPAESLMNDVFNAERDLTTRQDLDKLLGRGSKK